MSAETQQALTPDLVQISEFLRLLHGSKPSGMYFYIWHLDSKQSSWYRDVEAAIDHLHTVPVSQLTNLYTGVAWSLVAKSGGQRVRSMEASGGPAVWLDLDVAHPGAHKKPNLPPSIDEAHALVKSWAPPASIEVFSGHGLQHWWRFDEPWIVQDDADRKRLQMLIQGWQLAIIKLFAAHGWQVDATHDLARVMRIPGTINWKPGCEPVLATMRDCHADVTYDPWSLSARIEQMPGIQASLTSKEVAAANDEIDYDALRVDPDADVGNAKLEALFEIDPRVRAIWLRKWKGGFDESPSGWDASLASRVAMTGVWSAQEIVTLLKVYRKKYKCDDQRDDYYRLTVKNAFRFVAGSEAQVKVNELANEIAETDELLAHQRESVIATIKERLSGARFDRIKKFGEHPIKYIFTINGKNSAPINSRGVLSYKAVEEAIWECTNQPPPSLKLEHWRPIIQLLTHLIEEQPMDNDMTPAAKTAILVETYIPRRQVVTEPLAAITGPGVLDRGDGHLYILSSDFRAWLAMEHKEVIKAGEVTPGLADMGAIPEDIKLSHASSMKRAFWKLPQRFTDLLTDRQRTAPSANVDVDDDSSLI